MAAKPGMKVKNLLALGVFKVCEYVIIASLCSRMSHVSLCKGAVCKAERTMRETALGRGPLHDAPTCEELIRINT